MTSQIVRIAHLYMRRTASLFNSEERKKALWGSLAWKLRDSYRRFGHGKSPQIAFKVDLAKNQAKVKGIPGVENVGIIEFAPGPSWDPNDPISSPSTQAFLRLLTPTGQKLAQAEVTVPFRLFTDAALKQFAQKLSSVLFDLIGDVRAKNREPKPLSLEEVYAETAALLTLREGVQASAEPDKVLLTVSVESTDYLFEAVVDPEGKTWSIYIHQFMPGELVEQGKFATDPTPRFNVEPDPKGIAKEFSSVLAKFASKIEAQLIRANRNREEEERRKQREKQEEIRRRTQPTREEFLDDFRSFLRRITYGPAGRARSVDQDVNGRFPMFTVEPIERQREDHFGDELDEDGYSRDDWDSEGWNEDYAGPVYEATMKRLKDQFGEVIYDVEVDEKGFIEILLDPTKLPSA